MVNMTFVDYLLAFIAILSWSFAVITCWHLSQGDDAVWLLSFYGTTAISIVTTFSLVHRSIR
jgi:hypothetical protein